MNKKIDRYRKPRPLTATAIRLLLIAATWQTGAAVASAQVGFGNPNDRPTVSPYLNLFRRGDRNSTVLNYYGLVRPQNRAIQQTQQLNQGLNTLQRQALQPGQIGRRGIPRYSQMGITGHPTAFMTIGRGTAAIGAGGSPLGGSFVNDGVGIGVGSVGVPGVGSGFGGGAAGIGTAGVGAAGGFGGGGGFGAGGGFGGTGLPGGYGGVGLGTVTGHPAVFGAGGGAVGAGFGNQ